MNEGISESSLSLGGNAQLIGDRNEVQLEPIYKSHGWLRASDNTTLNLFHCGSIALTTEVCSPKSTARFCQAQSSRVDASGPPRLSVVGWPDC